MEQHAALLRATPEELDAAIQTFRIDPAFPAFVDFCRHRSIDLTIVSDGFDRVLRAVLEREQVSVRFFANRLDWQGGDRWKLGFPYAQPECRSRGGNCKCSHGVGRRGPCVVIGDGRSDFCMAQRADYVIAKAALLDFCRQRALPHASFSTFDDVTARLGRMAQLSEPLGDEPAFPCQRGTLGSAHVTAPSLPAEDHETYRMDQSIRLTGGRLGFLLIHGLGGTPLEMRYVAQGLAKAGHTVHVPQLAGHCGSSDDLRATSWGDWYGTVEQEHDRLRARCDTIVVGGLSMGAILAIHHAAMQPNTVSALALYAPTLWLDGWGVPWYACLFNLVKKKWCADYFAFAERSPGASKTSACARWSSRPLEVAIVPVLALPRYQAA